MYEVSWQVTEKEYREDDALSYSILAKYERTGFESIPYLFEKDSSNSLWLGSAFDIYFTDNENFADRVKMLNVDIDLKSKSAQLVIELFKRFHISYTSLKDFFDYEEGFIISQYLKDFYPTIKDYKKKVAKFIENDNLLRLYEELYDVDDIDNTILLNIQQWENLMAMIKSMNNTKQVKDILTNDKFERYYQLKFKTCLRRVNYKCMFDLIVLDRENKIIYPYDIKTTFDKAYKFPYNFLKWRYDIQDRLYLRILKWCLRNTEYKDYEIKDMTNIVMSTTDVNNPALLFQFPDCFKKGNIDIKGKVLRDPLNIGEEIHFILKNQAKHPLYIWEDSINNIKAILEDEHFKTMV